MSKNIIKFGSSKKIKSFEFETFVKGERGLREFSLGQFLDLKTEDSNKKDLNITKSHQGNTGENIQKVDEKVVYDKGFTDGYKKGFAEGELSSKKQYQAQKEDYINTLKSGIEESIKQLKPIKDAIDDLDAQLPDMVLGFVREIVGFETVLNDRLIVSKVKSVLEIIRHYTDITFMVSPDDLQFVNELNTGYNVVSDKSLGKGDLKVKTNIGIMDFSFKTLLNELKDRLDEEFKGSK